MFCFNMSIFSSSVFIIAFISSLLASYISSALSSDSIISVCNFSPKMDLKKRNSLLFLTSRPSLAKFISDIK